jgi:ABC-type polysaccharide/polyol phosphate transport system ATPase subunit
MHMVQYNRQGSNFRQQVGSLPSSNLFYSLEPVKVCIVKTVKKFIIFGIGMEKTLTGKQLINLFGILVRWNYVSISTEDDDASHFNMFPVLKQTLQDPIV